MSAYNGDFNDNFKLLHDVFYYLLLSSTYFNDVFDMTYVKNQLFTNWKKMKKTTLFTFIKVRLEEKW